MFARFSIAVLEGRKCWKKLSNQKFRHYNKASDTSYCFLTASFTRDPKTNKSEKGLGITLSAILQKITNIYGRFSYIMKLLLKIIHSFILLWNIIVLTQPRGNCNPGFKNSGLEMGHFKMRHFEKPHFPCSKLHRLD